MILIGNPIVVYGDEEIPPEVQRQIQNLKDKHSNVRYSAVLALGNIGDKRAVPALIKSLRDAPIAMDAAIALGKIKDESSVEALIELLEDEEYPAKKYAVIALGEIGDKIAVPGLTETLKDKNRRIQEAAAKALKKL